MRNLYVFTAALLAISIPGFCQTSFHIGSHLFELPVSYVSEVHYIGEGDGDSPSITRYYKGISEGFLQVVEETWEENEVVSIQVYTIDKSLLHPLYPVTQDTYEFSGFAGTINRIYIGCAAEGCIQHVRYTYWEEDSYPSPSTIVQIDGHDADAITRAFVEISGFVQAP